MLVVTLGASLMVDVIGKVTTSRRGVIQACERVIRVGEGQYF